MRPALKLVGGTDVPPEPQIKERRWQDAPVMVAVRAARDAVVRAGPPPCSPDTTEEMAQQAAYWLLYELGHVLDVLDRSEAAGQPRRTSVRTREMIWGRLVIEIDVEPEAAVMPCHRAASTSVRPSVRREEGGTP